MANEELYQEIGHFIHELARLRRVAVNRRLRPNGITRSQATLLAFLMRRDGMSQAALAEELDTTRVAVGGLLKHLEAKGLVMRREDQLDARAKRVYLTKAGQKLGSKIQKEVDRFNEKLLDSYPLGELQTTLRTMEYMKGRLLKIIDETSAPVTVTYRRERGGRP